MHPILAVLFSRTLAILLIKYLMIKFEKFLDTKIANDLME